MKKKDEQKEPVKVWEQVSYAFTPAELLELGAELARESQIIDDLHQEQKKLAAQFKFAVSDAEGRRWKLARKINEKSEMRDAECVVRLHTPVVGKKSLVRLDTGEIVREEKMTPAEMQDQLPFEGTPKEDDESQPYKRGPKVN